MKTMVSPGRYGPIEGPVDDQVVFAQYRQTGQWAPEALCLLETRLSGGGTFLDVGANIGLVTTRSCREPERWRTASSPRPTMSRC